MAFEIERKFLVCGEEWRTLGTPRPYRQGYIPTQNGTTVRVRIAGNQAWLTIKRSIRPVVRREYEYPIPLEDAQNLLDLACAHPLIEKHRTRLEWQGRVWEVDEFTGENQGLIVAEIELESETTPFAKPSWIGNEVTHDMRYTNSSLAVYPWRAWPEQQTADKR